MIDLCMTTDTLLTLHDTPMPTHTVPTMDLFCAHPGTRLCPHAPYTPVPTRPVYVTPSLLMCMGEWAYTHGIRHTILRYDEYCCMTNTVTVRVGTGHDKYRA